MKKVEFQFNYEVYDSSEDLNEQDAWLLNEARKTTKNAYAPYSKFQVGAAAKMSNGKSITGSNQENASFPVGICAERVLLSSASSFYPNVPVETIAITYHNDNGESKQPISPCGLCRQTLLEYEARFNQPIRLILGGMEGQVFIIDRAAMLLPLSFTSDDMNPQA